MSVKRFTGQNIREVMQLVRAELGDDAVIVTNRRVPGGIEIVAMTDEGIRAIEESQSSAPRVLPGRSPEPETKPSHRTGQESKLSFQEQLLLREKLRQQGELQPEKPLDNPFMKMEGELSVAQRSASTMHRKSMGKAAYNSQANTHSDLDDAGQSEVMVRLSASRSTVTARPEPQLAPKPESKPELEVFEAELVDETIELEAAGPVLPSTSERFAEDLRKSRAITEWSTQMVGDLHSMQDLIRRQILPRVSQSTVYAGINQLLAKAGFQKDLCTQMLSSLPGELAERRMDRNAIGRWVERALTERVSVMNSPDVWWGGRAVVAAVGTNGAGKSTAIAKLAARYVMESSPSDIAILSIDVENNESLRNHAEVMGIECRVVADFEDLSGAINAFSYKQVVLIDTPGYGYRHKKLKTLMKRLSDASAAMKLMLVIDSSGEAESLEAMTGAYKAAAADHGLTLDDCIVSKLDGSVRIGALISVMSRHQLRVNYQSSGNGVLEDFERGSAGELVRHALECYNVGAEISAVDGTQDAGEQFDGMRNTLLDNVGSMTQILNSIRREFKNAGFCEGTRSLESATTSRKNLPYGQLIDEQKGGQASFSSDRPEVLWAKNDYQVESAYFSLSPSDPYTDKTTPKISAGKSIRSIN